MEKDAPNNCTNWRTNGPTNPGEMARGGPTKGEPKLSGSDKEMMKAPKDAASGK